jgi:hypothetical protein
MRKHEQLSKLNPTLQNLLHHLLALTSGKLLEHLFLVRTQFQPLVLVVQAAVDEVAVAMAVMVVATAAFRMAVVAIMPLAVDLVGSPLCVRLFVVTIVLVASLERVRLRA